MLASARGLLASSQVYLLSWLAIFPAKLDSRFATAFVFAQWTGAAGLMAALVVKAERVVQHMVRSS